LEAPPTNHKTGDNMSQYTASNYDRSATGSPDYDSVIDKDEDRLPLPRTRSGKLKIVGDPNLGATNTKPQTDFPTVDFGSTYVPTLTPNPSRPATAAGLQGQRSPFERPLTAPNTPLTISPQVERQPANVVPEYGQKHDRPRPSHSRHPSQAWQPGVGAIRHNSIGADMTAEDFVQQRAAAARVPQGFIPHRSVSYGPLEQSPNKLQKKRNSTLVRPDSRGSLLDYSSHLSAREQEHVAKMTGGPLIQVNERSKTPDPSVGLIGAIEAREQERRNMKEGVAGQMVHAAIEQRQTAERNYAISQHPGYQGRDYQHAGQYQQTAQWHGYSAPLPGPGGWQYPQPYPQQYQPPYQPQQSYQHYQAQQHQQQPNPSYDPRYSGYYTPQSGYGPR
jgi:CCR4-NOT transcriptional complex subunit CAF120